jgi:hypothetical protein
LASLIQRFRQTLENPLYHMVAVPAAQNVDVKIQIGIGTERAQKFFHEFEAKMPD